MKLLIITQKVDINDDILGFFHGWIKKLAEKVKSIDVICLYKGKHDLPKNVKVFSLGKEEYSYHSHAIRRLVSLYGLYKYSFKLLRKNDLLFVHMNHKYILLLWPLTKIFRKPIVLWKTHRGMQTSLKIAIKLSNKVLTASRLSLDYFGKKKKVLGHGINIKLFSYYLYSDNLKKILLCVGRITPIKNQIKLVKLANYLINNLEYKNINFAVIGDTKNHRKDKLYLRRIKELIEKYKLENYFNFQEKIPNQKMPKIYQNCDMLIDLASNAGLDKAPLEAMSCGRVVLASQPALQETIEDYKQELSINLKNLQDIAKKVKKYLVLKKEEKEKIGKNHRENIIKKHSLDNLTNKLIKVFKEII